MLESSKNFGKRVEYSVACNALKQGLDVFIPLTDEKGIDLVLRREDATYIEVQVKGKSKRGSREMAADFSSITHTARPNYFFVFYSEHLDTFWIMSSQEFLKEAGQMESGDNKRKWWITLNGTAKNIETGEVEVFCKQKFNKYITKDFSRLKM